MKRVNRTGVAIAVWLAVVLAGNFALIRYSTVAGAASLDSDAFPADLSFERRRGRMTLVMIAHPKCPCTRASIAELARLMPRITTQVDAHVLFSVPEGEHENWARSSDLWTNANLIQGAQSHVDLGSVQTKRLGARTSGQSYLFAEDGRLLFSGGLTATRAHEGNSIGRERILELVATGQSDRSTSEVFGCPLEDEQQRPPSWKNKGATTDETL